MKRMVGILMMVGLMVGVWTDNLVNTAYAQDLAAPKIAFVSDRDGNTEIYIMKADGSDISRLSHDGENAETFISKPNRPLRDADGSAGTSGLC